MAPKNMRNVPGPQSYDQGTIQNNQYNEAAGSQKNSEVGRHLLPIPFQGEGIAYTTDASTVRVLPRKGMNLAVYNNAGAVGSITLGEDGTIATLAPGVTDAAGHVGIPCTPNQWTYIACSTQQWVIASAATLLVFIIDDNSSIKQEAAR